MLCNAIYVRRHVSKVNGYRINGVCLQYTVVNGDEAAIDFLGEDNGPFPLASLGHSKAVPPKSLSGYEWNS